MGPAERARRGFRKARQAFREISCRSSRRQELRNLKDFTGPDFWALFNSLPPEIQKLARANYELLKENPRHPSLHVKKALWAWIGSHRAAKILSYSGPQGHGGRRSLPTTDR